MNSKNNKNYRIDNSNIKNNNDNKNNNNNNNKNNNKSNISSITYLILTKLLMEGFWDKPTTSL